MIYLVKGAVSSISPKKRINGKISIDNELIGVEKSMAKILWSRYFIEAQGYNIAHNKLMQYNKNAILLENNVKLSISKWTKHIENRYLFVMYRVAHGDLEI